MAAVAYPAYDTFNRSMSRRPSISYGPAGQQVAFPYTDSQGMYGDPMMSAASDHYPMPSYPIYGPPASAPGQLTAYDDLGVRDSYYHDAAYGTPLRSRHRSASFSGMQTPHRRRSSSVSYGARPSLEGYRRPSHVLVKFKRKGALRAGITLGEAQANVRLSSSEAYWFQDLNVDHRGRILLKVRWSGYTSLTYEIPVDGYDDGTVSIQTLARRVARACMHFLQTNMIPVPWERVEIHHLEEITAGTWQPVLMAH